MAARNDAGGGVGGLGDRLRRARQGRGWTREELAVRAGISWSAIAQIEVGRRRNVRPDTLAALGRALAVTTDYLVDGAVSPALMLTHRAVIYRTDEDFLTAVGPPLAEGVDRGDPTLVVTSDANIDLVRGFLGKQKRVAYMRAAELYTEPDAALATYQGFVQRELRSGAGWAQILGEPVWDGRSRAQTRHWCTYESLINLAFAAQPVTIMCPYHERQVKPSILRQARETHPETVVDGRIATSSDYVEPGRIVLGRKPARP